MKNSIIEILEEVTESKAKLEARQALVSRIIPLLKAKNFTQLNKRIATYLEENLDGVHVTIAKTWEWSKAPNFKAYYTNDYNNGIEIWDVQSQEDLLEKLGKSLEPYTPYDQTIKLLNDKKKLAAMRKLTKELVALVREGGTSKDNSIIAALLHEEQLYI